MFIGTTAALNISHRHKHWQTQKNTFPLLHQVGCESSAAPRPGHIRTFPLLCEALSGFFNLLGISSAGCSSLSAELFASGLSSRMLSTGGRRWRGFTEAPWCHKSGGMEILCWCIWSQRRPLFCLLVFLVFKLHTTTNTNGVKRVHKASKDGRRWIRVAAHLLVFTRKTDSC